MAKACIAGCLFCLAYYASHCQELEPRIYAALPKKFNSVVAAYIITRGNVLTDPALPISGVSITTHGVSAGYLRTFGIGKKLARVQVGIPITHIVGKLTINGHDTTGARTGAGDARLRFSINLAGAPAYDKKEFAVYTQKTVFGVSLVTSIPTGIYHPEKRINIGSNRWAFKPEIGLSKRIRHIYAEAYAGVWFYTHNTRFLGSKRLTQEPVFSFQGHACYYFNNKMWLGISTTWFNGGKTEVDGTNAGDLIDNWRVGATWSVPLGKGHSLRVQWHTGAYTATAYDYNAAALTYQYVFF